MVTPGGLKRLFKLLGRDYFGPGQWQPCPVHIKRWLPSEECTLRIFPTLDGDFVFRCDSCEASWDTLELAAKVLNVGFGEASRLLHAHGVTLRVHSEGEIQAHQR